MKKYIAIAIGFAALGFAAGDKQTFTGVITDDMCEKADHKSMNMGPDAKCVTECVKGMGGKYVLYNGKTAYILSDQKPPEKFAAQRVTLEGTPGPLNAITDIAGIEVGHKTIISGEGSLSIGKGPVCTGVTVIQPRGEQSSGPAFAGWFSQNDNGEMTGTPWLEEPGFADGPILITNTHSVGILRDSVLAWLVNNNRRPGTKYVPSRLQEHSTGTGLKGITFAAASSDLNSANPFVKRSWESAHGPPERNAER